MNIKPILFNTAMVQAILRGQKTTTRRIIKVDSKLDFVGFGVEPKEIENTAAFGHGSFEDIVNCKVEEHIKAPYIPGDILYVRETFQQLTDENGINYIYKASGDYSDIIGLRWIPSIHMPKEAARIFLKVTSVKVERLQDITDDGCKAEGCYMPCYEVGTNKEKNDKTLFEIIWDSTVNKKDIDNYGWKANPYVWVIEFERIDKSDIEVG